MKIHQQLGIATLVLILAALAAPDASAQQAGRIAGKVTAPDGTPLEGVTITISQEVLSHDLVKTTNKKGKFTVSLSSGGRTYQFKLQKEGFQTVAVPVQAPVGGTLPREFVLFGRNEEGGQVVHAWVDRILQAEDQELLGIFRRP